MHSTNYLQLQNYDLAKGMEFVALWILLVFMVVLILGVRGQYNLLNDYDELYQRQRSDNWARALIILGYVKRTIFGILGYRGERREREPIGKLDENWIFANFGSILARFSTFYFVYIWALILTTRALLIDPVSGEAQVLPYTEKQILGFVMICFYILSNSFFDILSLYFTVRHLRKFQEKPSLRSAAYYTVLNLVYSFGFFVLSQAFSNIIWPLKTNLPIAWIDRPLSSAIAFWPYAFITDAQSSPPAYLVNLVFPGQLLITGTVLLPTIVVVLLLAVLIATTSLLQPLKSWMVKQDWALFGLIITMSPSGQAVYQFRCLNGFTIAVIGGVLSIALWEGLKSIASFV